MTDDDDDDELRTRWGHWLIQVLRTWLPALLLVVSVRTYAFEPYTIPTGSMVPTLQIGDRVVVDKLSYGIWAPATGVDVPFGDALWVPPRFEILDLGDPQRGDIIVFRYPRDPAVTYIKRVVATPGDHLEVRDNQVILDGVPQERRFVDHDVFVDDACRTSRTRKYVEDLDGVEHEMFTHAGLAGPLGDFPRKGEVEVPPDTVFVMGDNRDNSADSREWGFVRYDQIKGKAKFVWFSWDDCEQEPRGDRLFRSLYGPRR